MRTAMHTRPFLTVMSLVALWGCSGSGDGTTDNGRVTDQGAGGTRISGSTSSPTGGRAATGGNPSASNNSKATSSVDAAQQGGGGNATGGRTSASEASSSGTTTKGTTTSKPSAAGGSRPVAAGGNMPMAAGGATATAAAGTAAIAAGGRISGTAGMAATAAGGRATAAGGNTASVPGGGRASGSAGTKSSAAGSTPTSGGSASGYPLGNAAVQSDGCGKALSTFKTGLNSYNITSAGIKREYYVNIPSGYSPSKPYRLVFGMHCMGSSATQCAKNDHFYRLQPLDKDNTTIFVAPQGYTDSAPWRGGDNKDHTFFEEMVKLFESELCIDTSRIFSVGFSFGAMFTNSLAQTHQDVLRGVVVYATADYNIYFPTNSGKPLAYFGVHGTGDGTCPFKSGAASKDRFVKNNGCKAPSSVPEATSSTHVCYDYECPSNYPVKWCTHNGGHTDLPTDPGQSTSWDIDLTWKFITQF